MTTTEAPTETTQTCAGCGDPIVSRWITPRGQETPVLRAMAYPAPRGLVNCPACHTRRAMGW